MSAGNGAGPALARPDAAGYRRPTNGLRPLAALTALVVACGGGGQQAAGYVAGLYSADSVSRARAAERLIALGDSVVPFLDPFESGCIRSDSFPPRCRNFDLALHVTVEILGRLASGHDRTNPAKDLLWRMLHSPAGDVIDDLGQRDEWGRTDSDALRANVAAVLEGLMAVPGDLGEAEVARRAGASTVGEQRRWYLVANCAGGSMYAGCNYGSYVFAADGRLNSFRLIRWDAPDNFGAGVTLTLEFAAPGDTVGVVRAVGGFGGEREVLTFYRLGEEQAPLCRLGAVDQNRGLLGEYRRYVTIQERGCRLVKEDVRISFEPLS